MDSTAEGARAMSGKRRTARQLRRNTLSILLSANLMFGPMPLRSMDWISTVSSGCWKVAALLNTRHLTVLWQQVMANFSRLQGAQERQSQRDERVRSLEVYPPDAAGPAGQRHTFIAIPRDGDGAPVGGVPVSWRAEDIERQMDVFIGDGEFAAPWASTFRVVAEARGYAAAATVLTAQDLPTGSVDGMREPFEDIWRDQSPGTPTDVLNRRGRQRLNAGATQALESPDTPRHDGAGNGNFRLQAPLLELPGRGLNLSLALAYNSRVWTLDGSRQRITFDVDADWPAPGWSLGFGKLVDVDSTARLLIDADGTRHPYTPVAGEFRTTDGTFIRYGFDQASQAWLVKYPNGTTARFGATGAGALYPDRITDANGNYITIVYFGSAPFIRYIEDSLGRVITFHYDTDTFPVLLTAITAPGLQGGPERTLARIHYRQLPLNYAFDSSLQAQVRQVSNPWLIDAIYYPGTSTGYWFGDSDSFSGYGMLTKVIQARGMQFTPGPRFEKMGTITAGDINRQWLYSYPAAPDSTLRDAPTYQTVTESWAYMTGDPAVTTYSLTLYSEPQVEEITYPNGLHEKRFSHFRQMRFDDGLVYLQEMRDGSGTLLRKQDTTWEEGDDSSPRISRTEITNERGATARTEIDYHPRFNAPKEVRSYDFGGSLLKKVAFEYETSPGYEASHIFNLPKKVDVIEADGTRASRAEYSYDDFPLTSRAGLLHHSSASSFRGNLTKKTVYTDAVALSGDIVESRWYDETGNMVRASTSCCEQTSVEYQLATQYAYPTKVTRGAAEEIPSARVSTNATYDYNTGRRLSAVDPNDRETVFNYEPSSLRPQTTLLSTGGAIEYTYVDSEMSVEQTTLAAPLEIGLRTKTWLNGLGLVRQEDRWVGGGTWDIVSLQYDAMARLLMQSRPYRSGDTPLYTSFVYDLFSRVTAERLPDGSTDAQRSTTYHYYNEPDRPDTASAAPGTTVRTKDAWGRERWSRSDALGRLVEAVEPNPAGNGSVLLAGSLATTYRHNALDRLVEARQGNQQRSFKYDSMGRLTHQKLAERSTTLDESGAYLGGSGTWSDVFTYDVHSNLTSHTDARGVKKVYQYDDDPLNRLKGVSYDTSGFGDSANPILDAPAVVYEYMPAPGDVTRLLRVTTSGISTEEYGYDAEGRLSSKTVKMAGREGYGQQIEYTYDGLSRLTDIVYPREYGMAGEPRKPIRAEWDVASRPKALKVDGADYAWQFQYNAASQVTSMNVGSGAFGQIREQSDYELATGLLSDQKVRRGAAVLLDLSYSYLRPNTSFARTGQLSSVLNNLNHDRDKHYLYDPLARLIHVSSGRYDSPFWAIDYSYDRYGNRTGSTSVGYTPGGASEGGGQPDAIPTGDSAQNPLGAMTPSGNDAQFVSQSVPNFMIQGLNYDVSITMRNTGQSVWQQNQHRLGSQNPPNNTTWGSSRISTSLPVYPGRDVTYRLLARAPQEEGTYNFQWQMIEEGVEWFGDLTPNVPVRVIPPGPFPPSDLRLTVMSTTQIDLRWTANSTDEEGFEIERKIGVAGTYALIRTVGRGETTYSDRNLEPGTNYYYRVRAFYSDGRRSPFSNEANATTSGPAPTDGHGALSFDPASNRVTTDGFSYDDAGNQTRTVRADGARQRYQYDAAGQLAKVKDDAGATLELYSYDFARRRVRTQLGESSNSRTYYVWSGTSVIAEYVESDDSPAVPSWSRSYIYLGTRLLATSTRNGDQERVQYHHPDRLGTRLITNAQDPGYFEQATLPYGTSLGSESTGSTNRRFTSYDRSSVTTLDYAVNRHYDSSQGRFTQVDAMGFQASQLHSPQTLNLYAYTHGDPINRSDPLGLLDTIILYMDGGGGGHWEWWDYYSNGKYIGSSEPEWMGSGHVGVIDFSPGDVGGWWGDGGGGGSGPDAGITDGAASKQPPAKVDRCHRPAEIPVLGRLASAVGWEHEWLKTSQVEAGMGNPNGRHSSDIPYIRTTVVDHTGETGVCSPVTDVSEACVNAYLQMGRPTGRWSTWNNCNTFVGGVLDACGMSLLPETPPPHDYSQDICTGN